MRVYDIIKKKRDGVELSGEEISFFIKGVTSGSIPDCQISSLLMAVYFQGMTEEETAALTREMLYSGRVLDLNSIKDKKIDKHSTGGVGDKITLAAAPLAASCGVYIPMIAGRGLGHTGGTIDKLESIPGFRTDLTLEEFTRQVEKTGISIIGQTGEIAPADRRLYAIRDITATVESIPFITSSIMSKKLAEGIDALVLDIKVGSGAFMKNQDDARKLAKTMIEIGKGMGKKVIAVLTDMNQPLGMAVGNSLEVIEAIDVLNGKGPADVAELTVETSAWMLLLAGKADSMALGRQKIRKAIKSRSGLKKFKEMVAGQGGITDVIDNPSLFSSARYSETFAARGEGFISGIDAERVGIAAMHLGAGRIKVDDRIDHAAGIILNKKVGDQVRINEELAVIYFNNISKRDPTIKMLENAFSFCKDKVETKPLIIEVLN
ncbi:MAG: hypothetical protein A2073_08380 [Deltaproteobacteria bacterium GWC2_42_11]|nr:MAG: hypothetical protein A2073_08380 [Deltaproteobacteria bacterium GWC2_42_11]HBO84137.1 thymidine phosphorylase [Deltaproteobacteria bacterium]